MHNTGSYLIYWTPFDYFYCVIEKHTQSWLWEVCIRAFPRVLSMWLQKVKFIANKSKCAGLGQEIGFSAPNSCSLPWLVKGATQLCTSKKECNKLDLTAAQYFWLVDHNDWSRWFAISSPHICYSFIGGVAKTKTAKLRHLILLSRVTYWPPLEMLLVLT
jgi:hypothetical protein